LGHGSAQGQFIYFDQKYDFSDFTDGSATGLAEAPDGGYLFVHAGSLFTSAGSYVRMVKVDEVGDTLWTRPYVAYDGRFASARSTLTSDGNFAFLTSRGFDTSDGSFFLLWKFNMEGDTLFTTLFGDGTRTLTALNIIETSDSGFCMIGQNADNALQDGDMYLVRADSEGNILWEDQYGGNLFDGGRSLIQTPDGGFLLIGWTRSFGAGQRDFYLVKTDSLGDQEWQRTYGGSGDEIGQSIMRLTDGNYLLTGSGSQGSTGSIGRMYKVNSDGDVLWSKTYGYPNNSGNNLHRTVELWNGDLASAGMTNDLSNAGWLVRTDSEGNVLWQREYDYNSNTDLFYTLISTSDGGFLLGGQAKHDFPLTQDAWLLKVDSVGCTYADCLVGVDELNSSQVVADVWPNPASQFINIEWQRNGAAEIGLLDMTGKEVLRQSGNGQRQAVEVSHLPNGLYVLQLVQGEVQSSLRIVVQH
jgi:hypothetical protein